MASPPPPPRVPLPVCADPCLDLHGLAEEQLVLAARFGMEEAWVPLHLPRDVATAEEWMEAHGAALEALRARAGEGGAAGSASASAGGAAGSASASPLPTLHPLVSLSAASLPRRAHAQLVPALLDACAGEGPLALYLAPSAAAALRPHAQPFPLIAALAAERPLRVVVPAVSLPDAAALGAIVASLAEAGVPPDALLVSGVDYLLLRAALDAGTQVAIDCGGRLRATECADLLERFALVGAPRVALSVGGGPAADVLGLARLADEAHRRGWETSAAGHLAGATRAFFAGSGE